MKNTANIENELLTKALWDSSVDAMRITDINGIVIKVNNSYCSLTGFENKSLIGQPFDIVYDKKKCENFLGQHNEFLSGGKISDRAEKKITFTNGKQHHLEVSYSLIKMKNEDYVLTIIRDITDFMKATDDVRISNEKYKNLYGMIRMMCDNSPDMIWAKDLNNNYIFTNKAMCENLLIAKDTDEPIGKNDMFFAKRERDIHKDNHDWHTFGEICMDSDKVVLERKKPIRFDEFGNVKGEFLFLDVNKALFYDNEGNIIGTVGSGRDVTNEKKFDAELKIIQNELKNSEEKYRTIIESSHEIIIMVNSKGNFVFINKIAEDLTGYKISDWLGKSFAGVLHPDDLPRANQGLIDALKGKQDSYELRVIDSKGEIMILAFNTVPVFEEGKINNVVSFGRDITKQKFVESQLQLSETTFRGLLNTVTEAIYIMDENGIFLDVNATSEKMYGYERQEFIGKTPEFLSAPGMNDLEAITKAMGDAFNGIPQRFEFWGLKKDGTVFPKEVTLTDGTFFGKKVIITVARDITDRKMFEDALKNSEERYRAMVTNIDQLVIEFDEKGTYLNVWAEDNSLLVDPEKAKSGLTISDALGEKLASPFIERIKRVMSTGKPELYEYPLTVSGGPRWFSGRFNPIYSSDEKIKTVSFISRDITERKNVEKEILLKNEELKKLNSEKDKFFSIIAHDLRSPFTGFLGFTELMKNDLHNLSLNELKDISNKLNQSANNLYCLLNNLLEWAMMQGGLTNYLPDNYNLNSIVNDCVKSEYHLFNQKEISILTNIPENLSVFADRKMVEFIFRNLITNAFKFTNRKGSAVITAASINDSYIQVCVQDTGIGMDIILIDNLFKLNSNVKRPGTENEPSTGLGLILCKEFIEKNGGKIWAKSEQGYGSKFYFTLKKQ